VNFATIIHPVAQNTGSDPQTTKWEFRPPAPRGKEVSDNQQVSLGGLGVAT